MGYIDLFHAAVSVPHLVGGLERLVSTAVGSDEGPATGANSISGRAISARSWCQINRYISGTVADSPINMVHFSD